MNVVLKPSLDKALSGNLKTGIPNKKLNGHSVNMVYDFNKLGVFGGYSYFKRSNTYEYTMETKYDSSLTIQQGDDCQFTRSKHDFNLGMDYHLTQGTKINLSSKFSLKDFDDRSNVALSSLTDDYSSWMAKNKYSTKSLNLTSYLQHKFINDNTLEFDIQAYHQIGADNFEYYYDAESDQNEYLYDSSDIANTIIKGGGHYTINAIENLKLSTGIKFNTIQSELINSSQVGASQNTELSQNIYSYYLDAELFKSDFSLWGGLSMDLNTREITRAPRYDYFQYYPNLGLMYSASKQIKLTVSYEKSVTRASLEMLDPYVYMGDSGNYYHGNSELLDYFNHNLKVNVTFKKGVWFYKASLGYDYSPDIITTDLYLDDDEVIHHSYKNNSKQNDSYSSHLLNVKLSKWLALKINGNVCYSELSDFENNTNLLAWSGSFCATVSLPYAINLTPYFVYSGKDIISGGYSKKPNYVYLFLSKSMWDKKGTLGITAVQPFGDFKVSSEVSTSSYTYNSSYCFDIRSVQIYFNCRFNSDKKVLRKSVTKTKFIDEKKGKAY